VTIGQFSAHSGGLRSLVRSTGVAAQEIEEQLTHRQRNDVIRALAFAYLTRLNGIVRILQGRQSAHAESDPIPPVLPLELCSTSACDFIALVGTYKKRIDHHFKERSEEVIQNIYDQLTKLLEEVALDTKLNDALLSVSNQELEVEWAPGGSRFMDLKAFASGLVAVMPITSRVEGDCSDMTARRDFQCHNINNLDFSLEGVMHSKQLHQLQGHSIQNKNSCTLCTNMIDLNKHCKSFHTRCLPCMRRVGDDNREYHIPSAKA
jgi:hypothetical protein